MKYIGYKTMQYDDGFAISVYDKKLKFKLKKGNVIEMPFKGIFISTDKQFVEDYYQGMADTEVFITLEFDEKDIIAGNPKDKSSEMRIRKGTIKDFKIMTTSNFKITASEKQFILNNRKVVANKLQLDDWVMQKQSSYNYYGLITHPLNNNAFKAVIVDDDITSRGKAALKSIKNANPPFVKIDEKDIPEKLKLKILKKKKELVG
jgi:hypothetical protein